MTAASYKFDDGQNYPAKCFPARTLVRRGKDGGGHWLVAYRKAEEQRYSHMHRRIKETRKKHESSRVPDPPQGHTLDGPLLLRLHCVEKPFELSSVDISEQELNSVKSEDLKLFDNVAYVDASINALSLGSFRSFASLRELNLSVNGICNMTFDASDFPHLEVLDLSFNSLSADDIISLGSLARLKVLHLTGNQLRRLPPNLGSSIRDPTKLPAEEEDTRFRALEVLMLDDNKLSSGVFSSLTNLKRGTAFLKYHICNQRAVQNLWRLVLESKLRKRGLPTLSQILTVMNSSRESHRMKNLEECCTVSSLPLPELQSLNLSDNKIAEEEALMAVALFPMLREIDIRSNPLTTQRSGDPPLLTYYLQERLGITIKRKKTPEVVKPLLKVCTDPKWKVEERVPRASKKPLLMGAPCPAQAQDEETKVTVEETAESEDPNRRDDAFQENTEHFFVTQVGLVPTQFLCLFTRCYSNAQAAGVSGLQAAERETSEDKGGDEDDTVPEKVNCCKMLTDAKPNPGVAEPIGIQTAVRMLEHTLKNLNVYRDSKPKLDSIQMPYREREKRIKELPPLRPVKQPTERVDEMLTEIKASTAIKEVALSSAMHGAGVSKREALSLLEDMKTKYKMVHEKTMEQVASAGSDRNADLTGARPPPAQAL